MTPPETRAAQAADKAAPMDPRVAARLADVAAERRAEEAGARRKRGLLVLVGIAAVICIVGVSLSPLLGAHNVRVAGAAHTQPADVIAASRLHSSDALLRMNGGLVASRVEALPWVDHASVSRVWPQTVRITVTERTPVAVVPCGEGACLVDRAGRLLARAAAPAGPQVGPPPAPGGVDPGDLPVITNVEAGGLPGGEIPPSARPALAVALALPPVLRPMVMAVRGNGSVVELMLRLPGRDRNPPIVKLGEATRLPEKMTAAATVLTKQPQTGLDTLDVRVPEAPALTRNGRTP